MSKKKALTKGQKKKLRESISKIPVKEIRLISLIGSLFLTEKEAKNINSVVDLFELEIDENPDQKKFSADGIEDAEIISIRKK